MAKAFSTQPSSNYNYLAVDVDYCDGVACVAGVLFDRWTDSRPCAVVRSTVEIASDYRPGEFFLRELPCVTALIEEHQLSPEVIVVDGYVYLDGNTRPGLGRRLYDALGGRVTVVGVAKAPFRGVSDDYAVRRGKSDRPLYVTAEGMKLEAAKEAVRSMHGDNRIPILLKLVDKECRARKP